MFAWRTCTCSKDELEWSRIFNRHLQIAIVKQTTLSSNSFPAFSWACSSLSVKTCLCLCRLLSHKSFRSLSKSCAFNFLHQSIQVCRSSAPKLLHARASSACLPHFLRLRLRAPSECLVSTVAAPTSFALQDVLPFVVDQVSVGTPVHSGCPSRSPACMFHKCEFSALISVTQLFVLAFTPASVACVMLQCFIGHLRYSVPRLDFGNPAQSRSTSTFNVIFFFFTASETESAFWSSSRCLAILLLFLQTSSSFASMVAYSRFAHVLAQICHEQ